MPDAPNELESQLVVRRLAETLREVERIIDHQARAIEELDDKSEQFITLAVAALAGGIALGAFGVQQLAHGVDALAVALLGVAGGFNLIGLLFIVNSYIGFRQQIEVYVGPDVEWLVQKSNDRDWTLASHYLNVIAGFAGYYQNNLKKMSHSVHWRRRGVYVLVTGVAAYAATFLLILGRSIR